MSLYTYIILHGNLSFSSIPKSHYSKVVDVCYWPVLEMIDKGYRFGLEFPAETLVEIDKIDSLFIRELKRLWNEDKCDFIASSYSQAVFPLIPYEVNIKNLEFGKNVYKSFLGKVPKIAFINEMTCSNTLPSLYKKAGFDTIIMDWDNVAEFQNFPKELRYQTASIKTKYGKINVLWNSSLNSYKFQRCIYNRLPVDEYIKGIFALRRNGKKRAVVLYGTDWEMFNYRPSTGEVMSGEVEKIKDILNKIRNENGISLIRPSEVVKKVQNTSIKGIGSAECPIPCKNRDDYNVVRWAVSGRDDVQINTQCYRLFFNLMDIEEINDGKVETEELWKNLCVLWGSDFRTKTTNEKHYYFRNNMGYSLNAVLSLKDKILKNFKANRDFLIINTSGEDVSNEPVEAVFQFDKGRFRGYLGIKSKGKELISQCENFSYYRDGSIRSVKVVFLVTLKNKETLECSFFEKENEVTSNSFIRIDRDFINIETSNVKLSLCSSTGADIRKLKFPKISKLPLIKYLPPVYYDHIGHSNDYFSGWVQYCVGEGKIFNDTIKVRQYFKGVSYPIRIPVEFEMDLPFGKCIKRVYVYVMEPRVDLKYHFTFFDLNPTYIRAAITTYNPEAFNRKSLKYSSVNGTKDIETYMLRGKKVKHNSSITPFSSATTSLSATEGWVDISDDEKGLSIITDKSSLYTVPMIEYEEVNSKFLLRVYNSLSETDETGKILWRGHDEVSFTYYGHKNAIDKVRKKSRIINRKFTIVSGKECRIMR